MTSHVLSAALLFPLAVSGCSGGEPVESEVAPIIGGAQAGAFPEAVLVDMLRGGQMVAACSGSVIAPRVVLTAGHCVRGFDGWRVTAPHACGQTSSAGSGASYDWDTDSDTVDPDAHDLGLVFLDGPISVASYPVVADAPVDDGALVINVGRIQDGQFSSTSLFESQPVAVSDAASKGFPFDYLASQIIQSGDSGGPDFLSGTHTIVAVNSGAGGGTEVLARVDLLADWIQQQVASHGGGGRTGDPEEVW
jgi:hypothetical protein